MSSDVARLRKCLQDFDFRALFRELGWDRHPTGLTVALDGKTFKLQPVAEKRGFQVFECSSAVIPEHPIRSKVEREVAKSAHEHIIIYTDAEKTAQKWQWVRRELGRPLARKEDDFSRGQTGELLVQKLQYLQVDLEEEERITLVDVTRRARQAFDVDRITKKFYERFKKEHAEFLKFIQGITAAADSEWYASLMLNRLMFIYFIQKKGFLDGDPDYLRNRLRRSQAERGKDKFLTFYRHFLLRLFHEGLGQPSVARKKELDKLLGSVPYLNGGLFDPHDLERTYAGIQIADAAFEGLFDFFEFSDKEKGIRWQWHLDERPLRADNEINPDVLGYIFEKYINQKQMGAYYTKEDITGYIARNTIIPFLFNAAEKQCAIAFQPEGAVWRLLRDDPNRYIYPAVGHSVFCDTGHKPPRPLPAPMPLPPAVAEGVSDVSKRKGWNGPTTPEYGLPTETWREVVARRQRCEELQRKLKAGEIRTINDFITYNLDIDQFAMDVIENSEGPELLRAFYQAIENVSVLDPACGSGAFLFAALNILEPLYEACLERMEAFVNDVDRSPEGNRHGETFVDFRKVLKEVARHPNRRHFILKSIVINNLYGVDIMEEAVEICKLRLFLKLVAQVDDVDRLEPLPDIDFNIRPGNTLVGFATLDDVRKTILGVLTDDAPRNEVEAIIKEAEYVDEAFRMFHEIQTVMGMQASALTKAKHNLRAKLDSLNAKLDRYLAGEYCVEPDKLEDFRKWRKSHQPFHWFAEFYGIMRGGGFDVIIGNPPYVEYSKVRSQYQPQSYQTLPCGNIYTFVVERSFALNSTLGLCSLIVPLSLLCTDRMAPARKLLSTNHVWVPAFDMRPASIFEGVAQRLCVFICAHHGLGESVVTMAGYRRWTGQERPALLPLTRFTKIHTQSDWSMPLPKIAMPIERSILSKITGPKLSEAVDDRAKPIYIHRICRYFIKALDFVPHFVGADRRPGKSEDYKEFRFRNGDRTSIVCLINSSLFYWFWRVHADGFHCGYGDVYFMPFKTPVHKNHADKLADLHDALMKSLNRHSSTKTISTKKGPIEYQEFYPKESKPVMDEIDGVLAKHYGFTDEELDFIINYDIKYRLGQDGNGEGDE